MPSLVQSFDQVEQNAREWALIGEKPASKALETFSQFANWYYFPSLRTFAPGKFIGYVGTTIESYQGEGNGRDTKRKLDQWFRKIEEDSLIEKWRSRLDVYAKSLDKVVSKKTDKRGGVFLPLRCDPRSDEDDDNTPVCAKAVKFSQLWAQFKSHRSDLKFDRQLLEALHLGLWAHPQRHFAVLSGLSGTGKTLLALEYAKALTDAPSDSGHIEVVSVHPGWHDPGPLLGYVNPLTGKYNRTECLDFLLGASSSDDPHVLILDEMNLSHPEQYLAPILSAMEIKDGMIPLHRAEEELGVPMDIRYPANLVVIGTVNMDETTMGISDKVLDRAFTLEFWDVNPYEWPGWDRCGLDESNMDSTRQLLTDLSEALSPARRHFGWRVIEEVVGFLRRHQQAGFELEVVDALDQVVYAKVLPKLRGDDTKRFQVCLEKTLEVLKAGKLTKCQAKVQQLKEDLEATGSCSFWR